jgi:hypothetical protein
MSRKKAQLIEVNSPSSLTMEDYENEEAEVLAQGLQMPPQTHPAEPRIQPLIFSFSEEDLASDGEGSEYEEPLSGYALDGRFEASVGSDDSDSDGEGTDIATKIRKLQRKLEGGSSDSETDSGSGLTAHEGNEHSWSPEVPETAHFYQMQSVVPDSGSWKDGIAAEGSGEEDSGSDEASKEGGSGRSLWQGLGGDLAEREQRRKEMMQVDDHCQNRALFFKLPAEQLRACFFLSDPAALHICFYFQQREVGCQASTRRHISL